MESIQILISNEYGTKQFLVKKILFHLRDFTVFISPLIISFLIFHYEYYYIILAEYVFFLILLSYSILLKYIAYLPTENYFYSYISGKEYLNLFKNEKFDIEKWNTLFELPLDKIIDTYSTGMKKKLAILGLFKIDKLVIILDEPFNGLDVETSRILRSVLLKMKEKGKTIIVTSHILETLTNMCDYIYLLENGKIKQRVEKKEFADFEKNIFVSIENKNKNLIDDLAK